MNLPVFLPDIYLIYGIFDYPWGIFDMLMYLLYLKMMLFLFTIMYEPGCQDACLLSSYFHIAQCEDCSLIGLQLGF